MSYNKVSYVGLNCIDCPMKLSGLGCDGCLMGLGDSNPEIEAKANEMLNKIASISSNIAFGPRNGQEVKLAYAVGYVYRQPNQGIPRSQWYPLLVTDLFRSGMADRVRGELTALQEEFMAFLLAAGYAEGAAKHMAAFTSFVFPIQPGSNLLHPKWYHAWGTSEVVDALGGEVATWDAMRKSVIDNLKLWVWHAAPSPPLEDGRIAIENWDNAVAPYAVYLDWIWQKLLLMLRSSSRDSAQDKAIRAGIVGKYQQLLNRDPTATEMNTWFPIIRAGTKTLDDLETNIKSRIEYKQLHPDGGNGGGGGGGGGGGTGTVQAGMFSGLNFKNPLVLAGIGAVGFFLYWTQVKKKQMSQIPYVGKYMGKLKGGK